MPTNLPTFDLTFRPTERGPYNYEPFEGSDHSPGLEVDGALKNLMSVGPVFNAH